MTLQQLLEQLFSVKLTQVDQRGVEFRVDDGDVSRDRLEELIAAKKIEWQDPVEPDCGNGDGIDYVYVSLHNSEDWGELFVAIDRDNNHVHVS